MNCEEKAVGELTGNELKLIAVVAMVIDHFAWMLMYYADPFTLCLRTVGKLTMPIMAFFLVEGYHHTKDIRKYILRLGAFAVIAHVPFNLVIQWERVTLYPTSVMFTLLCGLLALVAWDRLPKLSLKLGAVAVLCAATAWADWKYFGVLFVMAFGLFYGDFKKQVTAYSVVVVVAVGYQMCNMGLGGYPVWVALPFLGLFLCLPLLARYHGQRGGGGTAMKWLFYIVYPGQFVVLYLFVRLMRLLVQVLT